LADEQGSSITYDTIHKRYSENIYLKDFLNTIDTLLKNLEEKENIERNDLRFNVGLTIDIPIPNFHSRTEPATFWSKEQKSGPTKHRKRIREPILKARGVRGDVSILTSVRHRPSSMGQKQLLYLAGAIDTKKWH
jgi:hypothetical protein